jgi:hypothetical protein
MGILKKGKTEYLRWHNKSVIITGSLTRLKMEEEVLSERK